MRALSLLLPLGGSAVLLSTLVGGCNAVSDNCETTVSCPDGTSGSSSMSGKSGASGSSGSSGTAGSEGESGAPGGGADQGGASGKGGASSAGAANNGGDGGASGAGGSSTTPCDTSKSPREEGCLVSDEFAVFVAPTGKDTNAGTQGAPYATLTKAVSAAGDLPILVCDATYDEHVSITKGARIFGGFKCSNWAVEASKPLFKPTTAGPALKIDSVAAAVVIDGVGFQVGDAEIMGGSSLAAIVNKAPKVTLRGVSLTAGKGKSGSDGSLSPFPFPEIASLNGHPENPAKAGGDENECLCQAGLKSIGGLGGPPSSSGLNGARGLPDLGAGLGGDPAPNDCGGGSSGKKGSDAAAQSAALGASAWGAIVGDAWVPAAGNDGANGQPGQGGGGGASLNSSGHGGGGGCGGCGGTGGTAGKGGGASIALLAIGSPVVLEGSLLAAADAANGGRGAAGQTGQQQVGVGGTTVSALNSCPGGVGGKGGAGGAGGGGAGGISVGVLWKGSMPSVGADTTISLGKAGAQGIGGLSGTNDGVTGVAQKLLTL